MTHEDQLRERITMALQSRHATDSVRVTTNNNTLTMGTDAVGMSTALRTYLFLERAMVELDGINPKVADDIRDRMDTIWHSLTESERARLDDRTEGLWSARAETGLGHDRTTVAWHESELDALAALAVALGLDTDGNEPCPVFYRIRTNAALLERDDARAEVARLRARLDAAAAVAADLIHEERCDWSGEPGREANCDCGVNTLRAMLAFKENP